MSSPNITLAMPAPGPSPVHLKMMRVGLELFGEDYLRGELFPIIRSAEIHIQSPARVAISTQLFYPGRHRPPQCCCLRHWLSAPRLAPSVYDRGSHWLRLRDNFARFSSFDAEYFWP